MFIVMGYQIWDIYIYSWSTKNHKHMVTKLQRNTHKSKSLCTQWWRIHASHQIAKTNCNLRKMNLLHHNFACYLKAGIYIYYFNKIFFILKNRKLSWHHHWLILELGRCCDAWELQETNDMNNIAAHDQYIGHEFHETSSKLAGGYKSNLLHMTSMRKVKGSFWVFWRRCHWSTAEKMWVFFVWNLDAIAKFLQVMAVGPSSWRQKVSPTYFYDHEEINMLTPYVSTYY